MVLEILNMYKIQIIKITAAKDRSISVSRRYDKIKKIQKYSITPRFETWTNAYKLTLSVKEHVAVTPTTTATTTATTTRTITNSTHLLMTLAKFAKVHAQLTRDMKSHLVLRVFKWTDAPKNTILHTYVYTCGRKAKHVFSLSLEEQTKLMQNMYGRVCVFGNKLSIRSEMYNFVYELYLSMMLMMIMLLLKLIWRTHL